MQSNFGHKDVAELQTAIASSVSPVSSDVYSTLLPFDMLICYKKCAFKSFFDSRSLALESLCGRQESATDANSQALAIGHTKMTFYQFL